jgi:hypothetical protein
MSLPPKAGAFGSTWAERFVEHCDSFCHPGATGGFGGENVVPCSVEVISSMNTSYSIYSYGQTPQFACAYVDDVPGDQKALCFVGQNAHVRDLGVHLATHSLGYLRVECYKIVIMLIIIIINNINPKP